MCAYPNDSKYCYSICIYGHGEALMSTHVYLPVIKHGFPGHSPCHRGFFPTNHL